MVAVRIVDRPLSALLRDPVFGRAWSVDVVEVTGADIGALRRYYMAVAYRHRVRIMGRCVTVVPVLATAVAHEQCHVAGIDGCDDPTCLMYERGDGWREKLSAPLRLWGRLVRGDWLCQKCRAILAGAPARR